MENSQYKQSLVSRMGGALCTPPGITISISVILAILAAWHSGAYIIVNTVVTGGMWALVAIGLALVFGVMNIVSFAHGEFFMIGALTSYFVFNPIYEYLLRAPNRFFEAVAPLIAMFVAVIAGCIVGILTEHIIFRPLRKRSRDQWVMNSFVITVGVSVLIVNVTQLVFGSDFRGIVSYWPYSAISFFDVYISMDRLLVFVISALVITFFFIFMKFSNTGRAIRAVSQDETGALMVGININGIQTLTLAMSCAFAALAGACLLFMYPSYPTVGLGPLYNSWFIVILAGMGNVAGATVGAFIVALLQVLTTVYIGEGWDYTIPSAFIIVLLIFKPSGIFGSAVRGVLEQ